MKHTIDELKKKLSYNKDDGLFTWNKSGKIAGSYDKKGYIIIQVDGKNYRAHRLAIAFIHGFFPTQEIDHINQIVSDNRIDNLREVDAKENSRNSTKYKTNKSGQTGVYFNKKICKWISYIMIDYKQIVLGSFIEFHEAVNARKNAEVLYGFHDNHGSDKESKRERK